MEDLRSTDFFYQRSRTPAIIILAVVCVIVVILIIYLLIYLFSLIPRKCTSSPTIPKNVEAGFINSKTFRVQWTAVPNASSYTVYIGQTEDFNRVNAINIVSSPISRVDVTGLPSGKFYYIFVTAVNACGESANSETIIYAFVQ